MRGRHSRPNFGRHSKAFAMPRAFDWAVSRFPGVFYVSLLGLGIAAGILICTIIKML